MEDEQWKTIEGFEQYEVSTLGRVRKGDNYNKLFLNPCGYPMVSIKSKSRRVHQLVAKAFIPNTDQTKNIVDHIDGNRANNNVYNLRWVNASQNAINSKTRESVSRVNGVTWNKQKQSWYVRITLNGKRKSMGYYKNLDDAINRRKELEELYYKEYRRKEHIVPEIKENNFEVNENEIWKPIKHYEGYEVSNIGNVRHKGRILNQAKLNGYSKVVLYKGKQRTHFQVHRLVADAFIVKNNESQTVVDHINNDRGDNRVENLRWVTHSQNGMNRSISKNNTTGYTGVYFLTGRQKYEAGIKINKKYINGGCFDTIEEAVARRKELEEIHFGEYAFKSI